mgnify:CR=1 FL=1
MGLGLVAAGHGDEGVEDRGLDEDRMHRVAAHVPVRLGGLQGDGLGVHPDPGLGGVVGAHARPGGEGGDRRDVDDGGGGAGPQVRHGVFAAEHHRAQIDLVLAVRVVDDLDAAIAHIRTYTSDHTEVIATEDSGHAERFVNALRSAVVMVNASSRFSDGGQLGLGSEIGISTTRLHAYGPMGLEALTVERFVVRGEGQVRTAKA